MSAMPDVVVLGAGFAGVACGTALAEAGARVEVLEASGAPGGRAGSFREPATGETIDVGQHLLVGANRDALALLDRLETRDQVAFQPALKIDYAWPGGRRERLSCPLLPAPLHLAAGLLRFRALPLRERLAAVRLGRAVRRLRGLEASHGPALQSPGVVPRPEETVSGWLARLAQGRTARRLFWEPLALAALNEIPDRAAARLFARVLTETFSGGRAGSALGWARGPLADLLAPAADWLRARGSALSCSRPAARLEFDGDRVRAVHLRDGTTVRAERFVSALPADALLALLGGAPAGAQPLASACGRFAGRSSPILSIYLWSEGPILASEFCALPGGPFQWLFERCRMAGSKGPASRFWPQTLVLSGARGWVERPDGVLAGIARDQLERTFPGATARIRHLRVVRQPAATFEPAPDLCAARPGTRTPLANLWLAGDWTDTGLPSTLEGAARSGHTAARLVRQDSLTSG
jgi:squalene-associated FAD-dependent desaturase